MKILTIRGKNLASLAGEFAIELEQGILGGVGLFAITGPTGAGKSTLLDALCLALFDRIPRLTGSPAVQIGPDGESSGQWVKSNDARSILRRSTAEGYAEVEFIGNDQRRYCARWAVRRARGHADGNIQNQDMILKDLSSGTTLSNKKTEVLKLVEERIGLSFDQFRRSVLLAQGDFAAFLKAKSDERSELLERMTGTEIYGELSKAAHQRASDERKRLSEIESRLQGVLPMPVEERQALEQLLAECQKQYRLADQEVQTARANVQWHQQRQKLQLAVNEALGSMVIAEQEWLGAEERRMSLERIKKAQPFRSVVMAYDSALNQVQAAQAGVENATREHVEAQAAFNEKKRFLAELEEMLTQLKQRNDDLQPVLQQAMLLDERLSIAQQNQAESAKQYDLAMDALTVAKVDQARLKDEWQGTLEQRQTATQWCQDNLHIEALAGQWQRWEAAFKDFVKVSSERKQAEAALSGLVACSAAINTELSRLQDSLQPVEQSAASSKGKVNQLEAAAGQYSLSDLRLQRQALEKQRNDLLLQAQMRERWQANFGLLTSVLQEIGVAQANIDAGEQELQQKEQQRVEILTRLEEAARALRVTEGVLSKDMTALRAQLSDGQPCMVCGSEHHPWASRQSELNLLLKEQQDRVTGLDKEQQKLMARLADIKAALSANREMLSQKQGQVTDLRADLEGLENKWLASVSGKDDAGRSIADIEVHEIQETLAEAEKHLADVSSNEHAAINAQEALSAARKELEKIAMRQAEITAAITELEIQRQDLLLSEVTAQGTLEQVQNEMARIQQDLEKPLAGIPGGLALLTEQPDQLLQDCAEQVRQWLEKQEALARLQESQQALLPQIAAADTNVLNQNRIVEERQREVIKHIESVAELSRERAGLLEGRSVAEVKIEATEALNNCQDKVVNSRDDCAHAGNRQSATEEALTLHRQNQETCFQALNDAGQRLQQLLEANQLELETLRERLNFGPEWLDAETGSLNQLSMAVENARIRVDERRQALEAHQRENCPQLSSEEAATAQETAECLLGDMQRLVAEKLGRLENDNSRREQYEQFKQEHKAQEERFGLWQSINELIGSFDGKNFRKFAQSLTLMTLLVHTNHHLADLTHRYRLQRAPGADLEMLVIDREMGDEVRSIHSLSGGETFLVSLALALGLASLSSQQAQVDSLFIDEGFGTLDPDTLETAVSCLEALQAQGRKVGVISHVETLVSRIGAQVRVERRSGGMSAIKVFVK